MPVADKQPKASWEGELRELAKEVSEGWKGYNELKVFTSKAIDEALEERDKFWYLREGIPSIERIETTAKREAIQEERRRIEEAVSNIDKDNPHSTYMGLSEVYIKKSKVLSLINQKNV